MTGPFTWTPQLELAVRRFLAARELDPGPFRAIPAGDGHSNLTYLLDGADRRLVLRRPPAPPLPPGAHDVLREARMLSVVSGSAVPVPAVLATGAAGEVFDVPFFVMEWVPGTVITGQVPEALATPAERGRIANALVDVLVELHDLDWRAAGVRGRPEGADLRHLASFGRLIAAADGTPPPDFEELDAWLVAHAPAESGGALLHNDLRLGNVLVAAQPPARIAAVLDWELAAVGDPLADLGYLLASWPEAGRPATAVERFGLAALEEGFPGRAALADRYADRSGRDLAALPWHVANAYRRLAVLYEYNRRRAAAGVGDPYYEDGSMVTGLLEAGLAATAG